MYKIVITGGIASGKTTVGNFFAEEGIDVIDTDKIAKDLVNQNPQVLATLSQHFKNILHSNGKLNRELLASIIFSNKHERQWLNNILHPLIYKELSKQINKSSSVYVIVLIPLLYETQNTYSFDRTLTISSNEKTQIARLKARNKLTTTQALQRINAQATNSQREHIANDIITNNDNTALKSIKQQVHLLHHNYLTLAKDKDT